MSEFVAACRELCTWLEEPPGDEEDERFTALVLLSRLHAAALQLPDVDSNSAGDPPLDEPDLTEQDEKVMARLGAFPTPAYWRLDGDGSDGGEKVEDSIARDLFLTYTAIRPGLDEFDSGPERRAWAIWSWRYTFWADWGSHAANAIQALQKHFHDKAWSDE